MSKEGETPPTGQVSYAEMRQVAQEIHRLEKQARQIRTGALICVGLLVGTAVFAGVIALLVAAFTETEIKEDGGQLAMVKKDTNKVVATTQSLEDIDGSDLVSYAKTKKLADGTMDGEWTLSDERIALIRTVSWKAGPVLEVHYVSEIVRHDGNQTRVEITTKAGHLITLWDDEGLLKGETPLEVFIKRFNKHNNSFGALEEINPNGDEKEGRGRVLVSLNRPVLAARPRPINVDDFFDDDVK